jgi:PAS domain S-box-containing protein
VDFALSKVNRVVQRSGTAARRVDEIAFHRALLAVVSEIVHTVDLHTPSFAWAGPVMVEILGWTPVQLEAMGADIRFIAYHHDDLARIRAADESVPGLRDGQVLETRFRLRHVDGHYRWVVRRLTPLRRSASGAVTHAMAATRDVSDAVRLEERLTRAALHDALTGLPCRALLLDRLATALQRRSCSGGAVPVLFCNLDGFKRVNDTSGVRAGDEVLVATAERLRQALRPQDTVARVGGDEFVIVLESSQLRAVDLDAPLGSPGAPMESIRADLRSETLGIVARLIEAVSEPVSVHDDSKGTTEHTVSLSIGVSFAGRGSDPEEVLGQADSAMYRAKASGKGRYQVFTEAFEPRSSSAASRIAPALGAAASG